MTESVKQEAPSFDLRQVYLKDASFESPASPYIFAELSEQPKIDLDVKIQYKAINEEKTIYECVLSIQATGKVKDKTAFLAEVQHAGIFLLRNFPENDIKPMMEIVAANQIFPYVRETVSHLATRGGFPPVLINPINFEALFRKKALNDAQKAKEEGTDSPSEKTHVENNQTTH